MAFFPTKSIKNPSGKSGIKYSNEQVEEARRWNWTQPLAKIVLSFEVLRRWRISEKAYCGMFAAAG